MSQVARQARAYPSFCSTKRLEYFYSPLDGRFVYRRVTPSIKFAGTHLFVHLGASDSPKNTTQCPRPGLESGPLDPETNALTMRPP